MKLQNMLEGIVIKWSCLINGIVIETSEKLFDGNANPTPAAEYTYWNNRLVNLENLYAQLTENNRKMVGVILEEIHSVYYSAFRQTFQNTVAALTQARDVHIHFQAFLKCTQFIQSNHFLECTAYIKPMLHCMCIMWSQSMYYPHENWAFLLKMIGNMLIEESMNTLDAESLFQNDMEDSITKINDVIDILNHYKYVLKWNEAEDEKSENSIYFFYNFCDAFHEESIFLAFFPISFYSNRSKENNK